MSKVRVAVLAILLGAVLAGLSMAPWYVHGYFGGLNKGVYIDRVGGCEYWTDTRRFDCYEV